MTQPSHRSTLLSSLLVLAVVAGAVLPERADAQTLPVGDAFEEYLRLLQLTADAGPGSFMVRPQVRVGVIGDSVVHPWRGRASGFEPRPTGGGLQLRALPASVSLYGNSAVPYGRNDGAVWQGKGVTGSLQAGAVVSVGPLTVTVRPQVIYHQNADFERPEPFRTLAGPYENTVRPDIDMPWRFGPEAFTTVDPGPSSVRLSLGGAEVGVGTEALWWGPGRENALILSNHAGGFPHGFLGTARPMDIGIGTLEAQWIWGRLSQSDWFAQEVASDERFITGAALVWSPSFVSGLSLGVTRTLVTLPEDGLGVRDYLGVLRGLDEERVTGRSPPDDPDHFDQLSSVVARWVFPDAGVEVWTEWARNDHSGTLGELVSELGRSQAYTLGLSTSGTFSPDRRWALGGELSHLEGATPNPLLARPVYYAHPGVRQGYTHEGQVLGAAIGSGSNAQHLWFDLYHPGGSWGLFLRREVLDNDAYYPEAERNGWGWCCHDLVGGGGARGMVFLPGGWELEGELGLYRDSNRGFRTQHDHWNLNGQLRLQWRPGGVR